MTILTDRLDQNSRMDQIRAELALLSYAKAAQLGSNTARQKPSGGDCPPGESNPLHLIYWERYVRTSGFDAREQVIADATDALIAARKRVAPIPQGETREQWEERLIRDGEGWAAREVAVRMLTGVREVVKLRQKFEREPHTGTRLEHQANVAELVQRGLTARQIAFITGKPASTVQYYVTKARKAA